MKLIAAHSKDEWTIEHTRYVDDLGMVQDSMSIIKNLDNPEKGIIHYPFIPPMKVKDFNKNTNIGDCTNDYTTTEYLDMLTNEILKK